MATKKTTDLEEIEIVQRRAPTVDANAEREACAKIADELSRNGNYDATTCARLAELIRARR